MFSVGIDIIEISRVKKSMKNPRFLKFILGKEEYSQAKAKGFPPQSIAADFCAKEAFVKAAGTGFAGIGVKNIQVLRDALGKPYFLLSGGALEFAKSNNVNFSVSLSHTKEYACASVICFDKNLEGKSYGKI